MVVAEGAGQHLFKGVPERRDASGNILKNEIGEFLCAKIKDHFNQIGKKSLSSILTRVILCAVFGKGNRCHFLYQLSENAVHAARQVKRIWSLAV
jgi:6-phosphofructokinase 1